jgi:hypothetical protein
VNPQNKIQACGMLASIIRIGLHIISGYYVFSHLFDVSEFLRSREILQGVAAVAVWCLRSLIGGA